MNGINKIISSVVIACFIVNTVASDYVYALDPGKISDGGIRANSAAVQSEILNAAGGKLLATKIAGPSAELVKDLVGYVPDFQGEVPDAIKLGVRFVEAEPAEWSINPILKMTNIKDAVEHFMRYEAKLPADKFRTDVVYYELKRGEEGELPFTRWIREEGSDVWTLQIHSDFEKTWNDLRKNDALFEYTFPDGQKRVVSAAWAIFYRIAKHEMGDLEKLTGLPKSDGHFTVFRDKKGHQIIKKIPAENEIEANMIGGRYALINDAIWMWFLASPCFGSGTQRDNDTLRNRCNFFFGLAKNPDKAKEVEWNRWAIEHNLPDELPNLHDAQAREKAIKLALLVNHRVYSRPKKEVSIPIIGKRTLQEEHLNRYIAVLAVNIEEASDATGASPLFVLWAAATKLHNYVRRALCYVLMHRGSLPGSAHGSSLDSESVISRAEPASRVNISGKFDNALRALAIDIVRQAADDPSTKIGSAVDESKKNISRAVAIVREYIGNVAGGKEAVSKMADEAIERAFGDVRSLESPELLDEVYARMKRNIEAVEFYERAPSIEEALYASGTPDQKSSEEIPDVRSLLGLIRTRVGSLRDASAGQSDIQLLVEHFIDDINGLIAIEDDKALAESILAKKAFSVWSEIEAFPARMAAYKEMLNIEPNVLGQLQYVIDHVKRLARSGKGLTFKSDLPASARDNPSILESAKAGIRNAAETMELDQGLLDRILKPKNITTVKFDIVLDGDTTSTTFWGFRALQNDARGPGKGGLRWLAAAGETPEEAKDTAVGLATLMTAKNAVIGIPYGGGKGDIFVPDRPYTDNDKARIIRAFSRGLTERGAVDTFVDVPAPDQRTDARMMAWFMDEYLGILTGKGLIYDKAIEAELKKVSASGDPQKTSYLDRYIKLLADDKEGVLQGFELGMITGKPPLKGGSEGRAKATGYGGFLALKAMLKHFAVVKDLSVDIIGKALNNDVKAVLKKDLAEMTAAIQGVGNAGEPIAWELYSAGVRINILEDAVREGNEKVIYTLYGQNGIDVELLNKNLERMPDGRWASLKTLPKKFLEKNGYKLLRGDAEFFWKTHTNIKVPAATENVITAANADMINCEIVLELANAPTTPTADGMLKKRGIFVIPDILANAGGVTVSYYEWLQNIEGRYSNEVTIDKMLEERMNIEGATVLSFADKYKVGLREAAFILYLARTADAEIARDAALREKYSSAKPYRHYGELGLFPDTIEELNDTIKRGNFTRLIEDSEAVKSREIDDIVYRALEKLPVTETNFILIAGPTTSGKLGLAVNIKDRLKLKGKNAIRLNFDNMTAEDLKRLKYGEEIESVDYVHGRKVTRRIKPRKGDIFVVEGNLTLSDSVLSVVPKKNRLGIFVNTAPSMKLADNWPLTSLDIRLLRHILTVNHTEGKPVIDVIRSWPAERKIQLERVYSSWAKADITFNGYLPYELPVIKFYAQGLIDEALEAAGHDNDLASIKIIERLERTLKGVVAAEATSGIPASSLTRQYIDGSGFYESLAAEGEEATPTADIIADGHEMIDPAVVPELLAKGKNAQVANWLKLAHADWKAGLLGAEEFLTELSLAIGNSQHRNAFISSREFIDLNAKIQLDFVDAYTLPLAEKALAMAQEAKDKPLMANVSVREGDKVVFVDSMGTIRVFNLSYPNNLVDRDMMLHFNAYLSKQGLLSIVQELPGGLTETGDDRYEMRGEGEGRKTVEEMLEGGLAANDARKPGESLESLPGDNATQAAPAVKPDTSPQVIEKDVIRTVESAPAHAGIGIAIHELKDYLSSSQVSIAELSSGGKSLAGGGEKEYIISRRGEKKFHILVKNDSFGLFRAVGIGVFSIYGTYKSGSAEYDEVMRILAMTAGVSSAMAPAQASASPTSADSAPQRAQDITGPKSAFNNTDLGEFDTPVFMQNLYRNDRVRYGAARRVMESVYVFPVDQGGAANFGNLPFSEGLEDVIGQRAVHIGAQANTNAILIHITKQLGRKRISDGEWVSFHDIGKLQFTGDYDPALYEKRILMHPDFQKLERDGKNRLFALGIEHDKNPNGSDEKPYIRNGEPVLNKTILTELEKLGVSLKDIAQDLPEIGLVKLGLYYDSQLIKTTDGMMVLEDMMNVFIELSHVSKKAGLAMAAENLGPKKFDFVKADSTIVRVTAGIKAEDADKIAKELTANGITWNDYQAQYAYWISDNSIAFVEALYRKKVDADVIKASAPVFLETIIVDGRQKDVMPETERLVRLERFAKAAYRPVMWLSAGAKDLPRVAMEIGRLNSLLEKAGKKSVPHVGFFPGRVVFLPILKQLKVDLDNEVRSGHFELLRPGDARLEGGKVVYNKSPALDKKLYELAIKYMAEMSRSVFDQLRDAHDKAMKNWWQYAGFDSLDVLERSATESASMGGTARQPEKICELMDTRNYPQALEWLETTYAAGDWNGLGRMVSIVRCLPYRLEMLNVIRQKIQHADVARVSRLGNISEMLTAGTKARDAGIDTFTNADGTQVTDDSLVPDLFSVAYPDATDSERNLFIKIANALRDNPQQGIITIGDLRANPRKDVAKIKNIGQASMGYIDEAFRRCGLIWSASPSAHTEIVVQSPEVAGGEQIGPAQVKANLDKGRKNFANVAVSIETIITEIADARNKLVLSKFSGEHIMIKLEIIPGLKNNLKNIYDAINQHPARADFAASAEFNRMLKRLKAKVPQHIIVMYGAETLTMPEDIQHVKAPDFQRLWQEQPPTTEITLASANDSLSGQHPLIKDFTVWIGRHIGPVSESMELAPADYKMWGQTVKLLHASKIEVYNSQKLGLTESMKRALGDVKQINEKNNGSFDCRQYASAERLKEFLEAINEHVAGLAALGLKDDVKRIVVIDNTSPDVVKLAEERPDLFRNVRIYTPELPENYFATGGMKMDSVDRSVHQARLFSIAIKIALLEKDNRTPFVESFLKSELEGRLPEDVTTAQYVAKITELEDPARAKDKIKYFLFDATVRLSEKIGKQLRLLKEFWTAA